LLTTGPGGRGLNFDNDTDFINTGVIGQVDNYSNLFVGTFTAPETGTYGLAPELLEVIGDAGTVTARRAAEYVAEATE